MKNRHNDLMNELNQRNNIKSPQDIKDGDFENIILGIKSEPYRTTHVNVNGEMSCRSSRSFRRQRSDNSSRLVTDESGPL